MKIETVENGWDEVTTKKIRITSLFRNPKRKDNSFLSAGEWVDFCAGNDSPMILSQLHDLENEEDYILSDLIHYKSHSSLFRFLEWCESLYNRIF